MLLSDKTYDILKYISIYVIPSLATFVGTVGGVFEWEYTLKAVTIIAATGMFIAGCIGMSVKAYEEAKKEQYEGGDE